MALFGPILVCNRFRRTRSRPMYTCQFCTSAKSFKREVDLVRHQAQVPYCRERKAMVELERHARLVPQMHSDSESDPEQDEDDGYGVIYGSDPEEATQFDVQPAAPHPFEVPAASVPAPAPTGTLPEPDVEDCFTQVYPLAAHVFDRVSPPYEHIYKDLDSSDNEYAPFKSREDWELAHWAKSNQITDSAFTQLLAIPGLCSGMSLSYSNARELNGVVDSLPLPARFKHTSISVSGHTGAYDLFFCDPMDVLRELLADPTFRDHVTWAAERCYADDSGKQRLWSEMTSSDWMWEMQGQIRVGGTVIPILLSTDKTQLTAFSGEHTAYPVYMSIGNIAKHVRRQPSLRAFRLIGYLPTLKPARQR
ncbi:hypothetical protein AURDEDRAFT_177772, partial [Auricularia subglabra TFB-10046 SS5]